MDVSHWYDAMPTVAGRPFAFYAEMLQSDLTFLKFVYDNSIMGKLADATGNHHQATASGIDGLELQEEFCKRLGVGHMVSPAQLPGLEFEMDVFYGLARTFETVNNLARYIRWGRSSDVALFSLPRKGKGSSSMPHKDLFGGNPIGEEQEGSIRNSSAGMLVTALLNCQMEYSRDLTASANARINLDSGFKLVDHGLRRCQSIVYDLIVDEDRSRERIGRTYGITTSNRVMSYLTDGRRCNDPMTRENAHHLMGTLATEAFTTKTPFSTILLGNEEVRSRISETDIMVLTNPLTYLGESQRIIGLVKEKCYQKKTLA